MHFQMNLFTITGLLILVGLAGDIVTRYFKYAPKITLFMLCGWLGGPEVLGLIRPDFVVQAKPFVDISLGIIMLNIGRLFVWDTLRPLPGLWQAAVGHVAGTLGFVSAGLMAAGYGWLPSLLVAAVGVSASPAISLVLVRRLHATGPMVVRSLSILALCNAVSFVLYVGLIWLWMGMDGTPALTAALGFFYLVVGSAALAYLLYTVGNAFAQKEMREERQTNSFMLLVGLLVLAIGLADALGLPSMFVCLLLGMMIGNLRHTKLLKERTFGDVEELFVMLLFVISGAKMRLGVVLEGFPFFLLFVTLRGAGSLFGLFWAQPAMKADTQEVLGMGGMLMPMAGLAIGLSYMTEEMAPVFGDQLAALLLGCVSVLEIVGPMLSKAALYANKAPQHLHH